MRDAILFAIFSGYLFFGAIGLFVAAALADGFISGDRNPLRNRAARFGALLAIPLAVLSAPPLPLALAALTLAAAIAHLATRGRRAIALVAVGAALGTAAWELQYFMRRSNVPTPTRAYVIGDSLSSSEFGRETPWPDVLSEQIGIPVVNLALASADTAMALQRQVPHLEKPVARGECVVIEIGGNDMLDRVDHARFAESLESILRAAGDGRSVVMMEMPVLPMRWAYGATQRRLARKYRCALIPRRVITKVLFGRGNTSDRIHLTQQGHAAFERELRSWLGWNAHSKVPQPRETPAHTKQQEIFIDTVAESNPLIVKGRARTFENTVSLRVRDAAGGSISEEFTTSVGEMGNHNPYEAELWLVRDPGARATVEAWEYSAKDGSVRSLTSKSVNVAAERLPIVLAFAGSDCAKTIEVRRNVPKSVSVARLLVEALLAGPTPAEKAAGASHPFPRGSDVRSVILRDGVLTVDFGDRLQNVGGSCAALAIRESVTSTLRRLPAVRRVVITAGGREDIALQP